MTSLLWCLARRLPQYQRRHAIWAQLYAALSRDATAQQKANRIKRRKLAGLRLGQRHLRSQMRALESLNTVHCAFLERLQREHPELAADIAVHHEDRVRALHP